MYARDIALIATPIGIVQISGTVDHVATISILPEPAVERQPTDGPVAEAAMQLRAWFAGTLFTFDLPLAPATTDRGAVLRAAMIALPYGDTIGYGQLARTIASSARAIGQACARNPLPIIVPCHRVLDGKGTLGSYSAGAGPTTKSWLLEHERRHSGRTLL
jgi:methylated-DNA-[protein]-cysteine S-methyltransferase